MFHSNAFHIEDHLITAEVEMTNTQQAGKAWCGQQKAVSVDQGFPGG